MRTLSLVLVLGAIGGGAAQIATSWYYWQHRHVRGLTALTPTALSSGIAATVYGVALAVPEPELSKLLYGVYFCGLAISTVGWFLFVLSWTERLPTVRSNWIPIFGVPYAVILTATLYDALVVGADPESATVAAFEVTTSVGLTVPQFVPVRLGIVYALLTFVLYVATLGLLLSFVMQPSQRLYRQQNRLVLFAMTIPATVEVVMRAASLPFEGMPVTALPATLAVVTAIFRYGIFNVSPVARQGLVEGLDAGILAYDDDGRIIDANSLARSLLGTSDQLVGKTVETVLANSSLDVEPGGDDPLRDSIDGREFAVGRDGDTRYFTARRSTIEDDGGEPIAKSLLFSDTTEQRIRERELDMLKQVFSRVLRHNLRNDMNVIEGAAAELAKTNDGRDAELAQQIQSKSSLLFDISEKARLVERVVECSTDRTTVHLVSIVEKVIKRMETSHPTATFETDLPDDLTVVAHPALEMAIENAVENAVEHGSTNPPSHAREDAVEHGSTNPPSHAREDDDDETVTVSVSASVEDDRCILKINDNGPGIPEHELEPLDEQAETPLRHASGVGLWLIQWVIDSSDGTLSFESSEEGTTVTMDLELRETTHSRSEQSRSIAPQPDAA